MFRKVTLGTKLICGFASVALIAAVVGIMGYWGVKRASETQNAINTLYLPSVNGLWMIKDGQDVIRRVELVMFLPQMTSNEIAGQKKNLGIAWAKAEKGWSIYAPLPKKGEEAALWEEFRKAWDSYKAEHQKVIALLDGSAAEKREAYDIASYDARDKFRSAQVLLDKLLELNIAATDKAVRDSDRQTKATVWVALIIAVAGVAGSLALGILLSAIISRNLNLVVASLSENSDQVLSTARSLSSSAQVLADGAAAEAASLEETSSAMEEVSSMVSRNTENSARAKELADRAGASVDRASTSMGAMLVSMKEISSTSEVTGKIVKSIDGIAFQTNILALNAAVEAARAGEAGASFAVVADEVRTLAQRVAKESKTTSELIEEAIRKIHDGTVLMEKTHADFREVAASVSSVTQLVGEISVASTEQARGIGEVGRAITQVDQVTQRTAANAEEIASSAAELSAWSGSLETTVASILEMVRGAGSAGARQPDGSDADEAPEALTNTLTKTLTKPLAADHPRGAPATGRPCRQGMGA